MPIVLNVKLQPKQFLLWNAVKFNDFVGKRAVGSIIGYGGSNGGAKSHGLRNVFIKELTDNAGQRAVIFRRYYDDVRKNHIDRIFEEHPELAVFYNKTEKTIYFENGSSLEFGFADTEDDIYKFRGQEYDLIGIDEAGDATEKQIRFLMTRNRSLKRRVPKTVLTFNPGGISHKYLKRIFCDKIYEGNEDAQDYRFIPARMWDNVELVAYQLQEDGISKDEYYGWDEQKRMDYTLKYADYAHKLSRLPEYQKRAFLFGDMDIYEGQFFDKFYREVHVIPKFDVPKEWTKVGGLDYGNTTVLEVLARSHEGEVYCIAELHMEEMTATQKAKRMKAFLDSIGLPNLTIYADVNMFGMNYKDIGSSEIVAQKFVELGMNLIKVTKAKVGGKGFREACNDAVRDALYWERDDTGKVTVSPRLFFFENCENIIKTLPMLLTDKVNLEDIMDGQDDHDFDALKYGFMRLLPPTAPPKSKWSPLRTIPTFLRKFTRDVEYANY